MTGRPPLRVWLAIGLATAGALVAVVPAEADPCAVSAGTVSGTVTAAGSGTPIAGARVRVQGCIGDPVLSDGSGQFTLTVPAGPRVVAVGAAGYLNGCAKADMAAPDCSTYAAGATGLAVVLDPLPTDDDPAHVFRDPEACRECHLEIFQQWDQSTMAHTNGNRWVDNLYNGTDLGMSAGPPPDPQNPPYFAFLTRHNQDAVHPTRLGECANCHQPEYVGLTPTSTNFNQFSAPSLHAVSCDFCHKITDVDLGLLTHPNLVEGKTTLLRSPSMPQIEFGPLDDVTFPGGDDMRAAHTATTGSSKVCAACHEDSTDVYPRPNGDFPGTYAGPASQRTYSEWAASSFATAGVQCQDCHMRPTGETQFCSQTSNVRDPSQVRSHAFEGTTPAMLASAVKLRSSSVVDGDTLTVTVGVSNTGAGHDLPTGVTLRNLILVVNARDRHGARLKQVADAGDRVQQVPNWGGVGDETKGAFAGLPGKGFARVLVDEFLTENVLFTEAVNAFDNRIAAGATDTSHYAFTLPKNWRKQNVRVDTQLYYRRAFKPIADQRKWNVPLGGNAHGTRGNGTDYDENFVMATATNFLTCKGKFTKVAASLSSDGTFTMGGVLKLPARTTLDPVSNGAQVALGDAATPNALLQERVSGFSTSAGAVVFHGDGSGGVDDLSFTRLGRRAYRMGLDASHLTPGSRRTVLLGLDSGDVCFRKLLRCKPAGAMQRCR